MAKRKKKEPKVVTVELRKLTPWEGNPRTITAEARAGLAASIDRWGLVAPIVWNRRTGHVVGGHQRLEILEERGVKMTQVVEVDLPPAEERALALALNNRAIQGDWTAPLEKIIDELRAEISDLPAELDFDRLRAEAAAMGPIDLDEESLPRGEAREVKCPKCGFRWNE